MSKRASSPSKEWFCKSAKNATRLPLFSNFFIKSSPIFAVVLLCPKKRRSPITIYATVAKFLYRRQRIRSARYIKMKFSNFDLLGRKSGSRRRALLQEPPFEGEEALFDKSRLLSLLPFSHHASQIAICSRSATRQCLPQANLQSRRSRGQDTSLALAASHTVGARARPLFFALPGKKFTHSSAKTFKKEGGTCKQSRNPQTER